MKTGRIALAIALVALALFAAGPLLARLEVVPPLVGFALFGLSAPVALVALIAAVVQWLRRGRTARLVAAAVLAVVPLATLAVLAVNRPDAPPINDITTDLDEPPRFVRAAERPALADADLSYPEAFHAPARQAYGDLGTTRIEQPPAAVASAAEAVARELGWQDVTVVETGDGEVLVEAVDVSGLFRFRDDVVVRVRVADDGRASLLDVRSRSRVGRGDLGANAARIRRFLTALDAELADAAR